MNEKLTVYTLVERSGSKVIPVGGRYTLDNVGVGKRAVVISGDDHYLTSKVNRVVYDSDEVIISTQNTVYTFKEAE